MLLLERDELRDPPVHRWGCSLEGVGQRAYLLGGWTATAAAHRSDILILDFEDELERRRRQEMEFYAKLERERQSEESLRFSHELQTKHELEVFIQAQRDREIRETSCMIEEDIRSSFPPLFKPQCVHFVKSNRNTIWLSWDAVTFNSRGIAVDPSTIKYSLYKQGGFPSLLKGDLVEVQQHQQSLVKSFTGVIQSASKQGETFTVKYDHKRGLEKGVIRERIGKVLNNAGEPETLSFEDKVLSEVCTIQIDLLHWELIYSGNLTDYACTHLVPTNILEKDSSYTRSFSFTLQVLGADYPIYENSLLSDVSTYYTSSEKNSSDVLSVKTQVYAFIDCHGENAHFERKDATYSSEGKFFHFL
jgi:hypothetical protein